jgi:hypothetical protein
MVKINYNIFALLPRHQDNLANSSLIGKGYFSSIMGRLGSRRFLSEASDATNPPVGAFQNLCPRALVLSF